MFIKNKKIYLVSLLVSIVGTIIYAIMDATGASVSGVGGTLSMIVMLIGVVASILCGSLGVYWSIVKLALGCGGGVALSFPALLILWLCKLFLIIIVVIVGIGAFLFFPGVFAIIAWFKNKDLLVE